MRNRVQFLSILAISLFLISCDEIENELDIEKGSDTKSVANISEGTTWSIQTHGVLVKRDVELSIIDLFNYSFFEIRSLKDANISPICQFSIGTYSNSNPFDNHDFPEVGVGNPISNGKYWVDITNETIKNIMVSRLEYAVEKGCVGVNLIDANNHKEDTGFSTTYAEQIGFNTFLSNEAHKLGLSVGFLDIDDHILSISKNVDFLTSSSCYIKDSCYKYESFTKQDKAVFNIEYNPLYFTDSSALEDLCLNSKAYDIETIVFEKEDFNGTYSYICN
jgi:hypothetical protein